MSWLFFAIAAPALYAATIFIDKFIIEKYIEDLIALVIIGGGVSFALGLVILSVRHFTFLGWGICGFIVLSGALAESALLPYFRALKYDDASRLIPLFQVVPLFVLALAYFFLGEQLQGSQLFGFFFVLAGGFLVSLKRLDKRIFSLRPSFWYMMLSSLLYAIAAVIFKFIVTPANFWDIIAYEIIGASMLAFALCLYRPYRIRSVRVLRIAKRIWGAFVMNEAVYLGARMSVAYAFALASVSLVSVLNGFQPLFALAYGVILSLWFPRILKEDIRGNTITLKVVAICLIFIGLWLIRV